MSQAKGRKNVIKRNQVKLNTRPKTLKMSSHELHNIMLINLMCKVYLKNSINLHGCAAFGTFLSSMDNYHCPYADQPLI